MIEGRPGFSPVVILILLGLKEVTGDTLLPASLPTIDDFGGLVLLIIYAFIGFEVATVVAGETKKPRRTMPRALVATVVATSILYFLIMLVYVSVLPESEWDGGTLADAGRILAGGVGAVVIALTAVFSIGGNLAANALSMPRMTFALGEQGLMPEWFARIHPRFATPGNSVLVFGTAGLLLALSGTFTLLAGASSLARLFAYVLSIAALPRVRARATPEVAAGAFKLPLGWLIPVVALMLCAWIAAHAPMDAWSLMLGLLVVGWLFFAATRAGARRGRVRQN